MDTTTEKTAYRVTESRGKDEGDGNTDCLNILRISLLINIPSLYFRINTNDDSNGDAIFVIT